MLRYKSSLFKVHRSLSLLSLFWKTGRGENSPIQVSHGVTFPWKRPKNLSTNIELSIGNSVWDKCQLRSFLLYFLFMGKMRGNFSLLVFLQDLGQVLDKCIKIDKSCKSKGSTVLKMQQMFSESDCEGFFFVVMSFYA